MYYIRGWNKQKSLADDFIVSLLKIKIIKNVPEKTSCKLLMTTHSKLLSKYESSKTLEEGHYETNRNKYKRER